ncbi:hypothetical protein [Fimbriiglobus ruber]|uniref:Phage protein n=1 Tax=Fimbriiglobus ruber TaxID=1908690 RepID=A0A225E0K2_9BACT|nr:hypothetical protein [Fimbriiglobus ruber]OWK42205.1 Phage protein [Fimbriiglobus ruber]
MVQTFGTNASNDLFLGPDGNLVVLAGIAAVEAACATATKAQLGEMVFATETGVPNFQTLWVGSPEYALWKAAVLSTLQSVPGVTAVTSLNLTVSGSTVSYVAQITTQYSTTPSTITG